MLTTSITTDFHSHVAGSSAHAMAHAARERGLRAIGLSEHIFQIAEARPLLPDVELEGPLLTFSGYVESVRAAARDLTFDVRLGLEVDCVPEKHAQLQAHLQGIDWDFLIGSVHEVDGLDFERERRMSREQGEHLWLRYMQLLRDAANSGAFSVISHPVRMRVQNPFLPRTLDSELDQLAAEAAHANVALELNGFDMLNYPGLVRRLAKACAQQKTPISVGSDAHMPNRVAQAHTQTAALLREVGITSVRIWKRRAPEDYILADF